MVGRCKKSEPKGATYRDREKRQMEESGSRKRHSVMVLHADSNLNKATIVFRSSQRDSFIRVPELATVILLHLNLGSPERTKFE